MTAPDARAAMVRLEDLPNVGPATAADLRLLGVTHPGELVGRDPVALYDALCAATGVRHDPCVLDVFLSVVRYMEGAPALPWWRYTAERKRLMRDRTAGGRASGARPAGVDCQQQGQPQRRPRRQQQ